MCQGTVDPASGSSRGAFALWCSQGKGFEETNVDLRLEGRGSSLFLTLLFTHSLLLAPGFITSLEEPTEPISGISCTENYAQADKRRNPNREQGVKSREAELVNEPSDME